MRDTLAISAILPFGEMPSPSGAPGLSSDKPPGADPSVTKTETEWQIAVGGAALTFASLGALLCARLASREDAAPCQRRCRQYYTAE